MQMPPTPRTQTMRKRMLLGAAVGVFALLLACGGTPDGTVADATATADSSATAAPTTVAPAPTSATVTTSAAPVFTETGTGPYQLGASLATLQAGGSLDQVAQNTEVCTLNTSARGTGVWADVRLSFRQDGNLYLVTNRSASIPTTTGAAVGTTRTQLQALYPGLQALPQGFALFSAPSGNGILFDFDPADKIFTMSAADADFLQSSVENGTDFC